MKRAICLLLCLLPLCTAAEERQLGLPDASEMLMLSRAFCPESTKEVAYQPGYPVSAALFTVDAPEAVRVEIVSLDDLEYPVVTVRGVYQHQQEDGSWTLVAAFDTASDVCKTTRETLRATLYSIDGTPLEILTLYFHAPNW